MRFPGTRIAALLVWALAALPVLFAQEVAVGGFVRLDHYGGVAEESFYSNERVRLTALTQLRADDEAGFWSAFLEVVAHLQYDDEGFSVAPGALTARDIDDMIRRAYVSLRFDAFDVEVGKKFVHWGKVDFLSPLDVINHVNLEVPALGDLFEGPLADPLLHVTAYPTDELSIELVYVPFLAPWWSKWRSWRSMWSSAYWISIWRLAFPRWSRSRTSRTRCTAQSPTPPFWPIFSSATLTSGTRSPTSI